MSTVAAVPLSRYDARLRAAGEALGLSLTDGQRAGLLGYLAQMQRWNKTYNLTALRDPEQMLVQHVFDSLSVVAPFARALESVAEPSILDVGSGGGLPGVVLAIVRPDWRVCCIDAVEKKAAFIRQMAGVLRLPNLSARHARIETVEPLACDLVVSRAFASLLDFASLAGRHVAADGTLVAMKGRDPQDEVQALHDDGRWQVQRTQTLVVPELDAHRCLIWMRRKGTRD